MKTKSAKPKPQFIVRKAQAKVLRRPTKKAVKRAIDFLAPGLLAIVVVGASAAAGSGDYALILPTERVCAKSLETCEEARQAISRGWLGWATVDATTRCEPSPDCFAPASNCIRGYNCQ